MEGVNGKVVLVAEFDQPTVAREAMVALESQGIDAEQIKLVEGGASVPSPEQTRSAELAATGDVAKRYGGWGLIGAVIGAAVLAGLVILITGEVNIATVAGGILAGGISGFVLAGYWGGASKLPVNEEAFDTYAMGPDGSEPVSVEVALDNATVADETAEFLRAHHAQKVERRS